MPVDQALEATVTTALDVTQTAVSAAAAATPDQVGNALDAAIQIGNMLPHSEGSWVALALAALVVMRFMWKKYQASKK